MDSKTSYEKLDLEVIIFEAEDIITGSNCPTEGEIVGD